ncbi:MAG TPA: tetratricopeptide repeat protein [Candidatus Acidoferrales bacterium]
MSFLRNRLGKKPEAKPADPATDKNMIRVYDGYGREFFVPKEEWRAKVLPGNIKSNWNNPEVLYTVIVGALKDGFRSEIVAAAGQLYKIDPDRACAACVWGIVLMDEGRLDDAEKVFRDFISKHGDDGSILTNLAKVYSKRKNTSMADEILWHALEVDPNQESGLSWYQAIFREREGSFSEEAALRRVATLPKSWRAQLRLARTALQSHNLEQALAYYRESFSRADNPAPTDMLMQISGDLGNAGYLAELLQLVEPHFVFAVHGLQVGNNLIKSHLDLGHLDEARRILDQLYSLKRPDWQKTLSYWDTELAKKRLESENPDAYTAPEASMLTIEGPVWLKPTSPAAELFPRNLPDAIGVSFLGCSATVTADSDRIQHQLADDKGRMSRALPLFLAEQVVFNCKARVQTLVPWMAAGSGGFILSGEPWSDEDASKYARQTDNKNEFVVLSHIKALTEPWTLELRLIRTVDAKLLGNLACSFPPAKPEDSIPEFARQLLKLLTKEANVESRSAGKNYEVPPDKNFPYYLLRLEQLLAVRCSSMDGVPKDFLSGAREILDGNIELCLSCPTNITARVLLAQTLQTMKRVRPDILPEFKDKLALLQKEKPLTEPARTMIQQMFTEAITS